VWSRARSADDAAADDAAGGRYVAGLFALVVLDTRRKDFLQMSAHHVVTILLLTLSFAASHMRVGAVVIVLHNISDPFLQFAKLCKVQPTPSSPRPAPPRLAPRQQRTSQPCPADPNETTAALRATAWQQARRVVRTLAGC
jgi:hypothetical protein